LYSAFAISHAMAAKISAKKGLKKAAQNNVMFSP